MPDITKDDLRVCETIHDVEGKHDKCFTDEVSDEEFDRLARDAGYIPLAEGAVLEYYRTYANDSERARMLGALLTDECDCHGEKGCWCQIALSDWHPLDVSHTALNVQRYDAPPHPRCGGRGWLPKDGVTLMEYNQTQALGGGIVTELVISADWLEAEDGQ